MQVTTHARVQVPTLLLSPASQLLCTLTSSKQQTSNRGPFPSHGRPQELVPGFQLWPDQAAATAYTWEVEQQEAFCLPCKLKVWNANFVSVKHIHNTIHYDVVIFRVFFFFSGVHSLRVFPLTSWVCVRLRKEKKRKDNEPNWMFSKLYPRIFVSISEADMGFLLAHC